MAVFVANVGVNAGHAARSPLFDDGTFELLPVPETKPWRPPMLRLDTYPRLLPYAPESWRHRAVHFDPDLVSQSPTYGDNCRNAGRAFSLRRANAGDLIVFLARLRPTTTQPGFYLVGCLQIETAITEVTSDPGSGWWDNNAHIRRARAINQWDSFWVFKGTRKSRLFQRAVPFDRASALRVFGDNWLWRQNRTELQTIGSYTRAIRRVEGRGEEWLRTICLS